MTTSSSTDRPRAQKFKSIRHTLALVLAALLTVAPEAAIAANRGTAKVKPEKKTSVRTSSSATATKQADRRNKSKATTRKKTRATLTSKLRPSTKKVDAEETESGEISPLSDTLAGYVVSFNRKTRTVRLKLANGLVTKVKLAPDTYAETIRNLGEGFQSPEGGMDSLFTKDRYIFVQGISYPNKQRRGRGMPEAKRIVASSQQTGRPRFEEPRWWTNQVESVADFYLRSQFPDGKFDFRKYRTNLMSDGTKVGRRQETATLSRMVYGLATAYMLTGEDRFFEAAEAGTDYMRDNMREVDSKKGVTIWHHALDVDGSKVNKVLASTFSDDEGAIAAYEQIYALAGPVQTYRLTGDPRIRTDADMTLNLFDNYFRDSKKGGYFSHIDPKTFDPRADSLGQNKARKNWNSVGDHAPAYLINLALATGDQRYAKMLEETGDTIATKFPESDTDMLQERFHEDWSPDKNWGWQQDRGVVGHNLKVAWNLTRLGAMKDDPRYRRLANRLGKRMADVGRDKQRGGWFDVMERTVAEGQDENRLTWHSRKPWWQQEQAILAYLILGGTTKNKADRKKYLGLARESSAFYNAFFLDHDLGGVNFNVNADGSAYRAGTELRKGSHSMSAYHSVELGFLATVYQSLLVNKEPLDLHFRPKVGGFADNTLRVAPDMLPPGRVRLDAVWIDGKEYKDFDPEAMTVKLPTPPNTQQRSGTKWAGKPRAGQSDDKSDYKVRVRLVAVD